MYSSCDQKQSILLSVRRHVVERALIWLKRHNHRYSNIDIDTAEMDSWEAPAHGVPSQVYGRLEKNEPSAWETEGKVIHHIGSIIVHQQLIKEHLTHCPRYLRLMHSTDPRKSAHTRQGAPY
jgi:hypothetical protein